MQNNRILVVLGTGGTIAGTARRADDNVGYEAATVGIGELVSSLPEAAGVVIETEQVAQLDSKDMDFATWRQIALRVAHHAGRAEVAAIVIAHGTDTLEETAYFLARVVAVAKPVVLTAAMRPSSSRQADGPQNLADAITVATHAGQAGVVAVLAGTVHSAHDVRKIHPYRVDAFSSGDAGPLAHVEEGRIRALRPWPQEAVIGIEALPLDAAAWPWVEIVTSAVGASGKAVGALAGAGVDGIVVATTGNGSVHHALQAALAEAMGRGVAVLRSTRCLDGMIVEASAGALPSAGGLTPVKARIDVMLGLLAARSAVKPASQTSGEAP